ncbi:MAG TPA: hypothetical protein VL463_17450 [Kofleriaceae bacterium]|nr:hypothetical protein [Kofleriaceae bacterium]
MASVALADPDAAVSSTGTLRNGFSLSAGQEFGGDRDISATMFGVDWRIGWRFSEALSAHLHSHLSFGSGKEANGASGLTGTFASAAVLEYTLPMGAFVGAGAGYGVLNNPNGGLVEARAGYYPFGTAGTEKQRRLNVTLDYRAFFANQGYGTVSSVALSIGYDTF